MFDLIIFVVYIIIGLGFVAAFCYYADIKIYDTANFGVYVVLVCLWPAILMCGIILVIIDWFNELGGGPSLFA